jgi:TctA family transporter
MSQGSLSIFVDRPIAGVITAVALLFFLMPIIGPWWRRLRGLPVAEPAPREI